MSKQAVAAKLVGSVVKLYDPNGLQFKTLNGTGGTSVTVSGNRIALSLKNGRIKLFDLTGRQIRII